MTGEKAGKVLIMAGGTGGHVYPALSVADKLLSHNVVIEWLGTQRGIENELVPKRGLPLNFIRIRGLRGKGVLRWALLPWQLLLAMTQALLLIKRIKPDVVLGLGGFASGPGGLAAWLLSKPLIIHEQNAVPGLTNRCLNKLATVSLQGFPNSLRGAETVGNPLREEIVNIQPRAQQGQGRRKDTQDKPHLLVLGGSLGALTLNRLLPETLGAIDAEQRPTVWHQSGAAHYQYTQNLYRRHGVDARIESFISDMHGAYAWADLVICRAGALTVSEISAAGVAAIFVPYPFAADNHQLKNAHYLVERSAAMVVAEQDLSVDRLKTLLEDTLTDTEKLASMSTNSRNASVTGAAEAVAKKCLEFING